MTAGQPPPGFAAWRTQVRNCLQAGLPPDQVHWSCGDSQLGLFGETATGSAPPPPASGGRPVNMPRAFVDLAATVACHQDPQRWGLLYQAAWRIRFESRSLLSQPADPLVQTLERMQKSVHRDIHKMKAFVRFQAVTPDPSDALDTPTGEEYVAWFEPDHFIVQRVAPFFARRFTGMHWTLFTPRGSARWDGQSLQLERGCPERPAGPADPLEPLWRTYYRSIFNPARLKVDAMCAEMPRKYWKNLPEAQDIQALILQANHRTCQMIEQPPSPRWRVSERSRKVAETQAITRAREE